MQPISKDAVRQHLELLREAQVEDLDELLHDLLVKVYPSKAAQNN